MEFLNHVRNLGVGVYSRGSDVGKSPALFVYRILINLLNLIILYHKVDRIIYLKKDLGVMRKLQVSGLGQDLKRFTCRSQSKLQKD